MVQANDLVLVHNAARIWGTSFYKASNMAH